MVKPFGCLVFGEWSWFDAKEVTELSIESALDEDIEVEHIVENPIDLSNIGMAEVHLYLDLPQHLLNHIVLPYLLLSHYLYRAYHTTPSLLGQHHPPECSPSQLPNYFEVGDCQFAWSGVGAVKALTVLFGCSEEGWNFLSVCIVGMFSLHFRRIGL